MLRMTLRERPRRGQAPQHVAMGTQPVLHPKNDPVWRTMRIDATRSAATTPTVTPTAIPATSAGDVEVDDVA